MARRSLLTRLCPLQRSKLYRRRRQRLQRRRRCQHQQFQHRRYPQHLALISRQYPPHKGDVTSLLNLQVLMTGASRLTTRLMTRTMMTLRQQETRGRSRKVFQVSTLRLEMLITSTRRKIHALTWRSSQMQRMMTGMMRTTHLKTTSLSSTSSYPCLQSFGLTAISLLQAVGWKILYRGQCLTSC